MLPPLYFRDEQCGSCALGLPGKANKLFGPAAHCSASCSQNKPSGPITASIHQTCRAAAFPYAGYANLIFHTSEGNKTKLYVQP